MSDTTVQDCDCCQTETDCIQGLCALCSDYNYKLQKQSDILTFGLLQEKSSLAETKEALKQCEKERGLNAGAVVALTIKLDNLISRMESINQRAKNGSPCTDIQVISADALVKAKGE